MYIGICIFLIICIIMAYLDICRKPYAIQKVRRLCAEEKYRLLSSLVSPAGFAYDRWQDIFVSKTDAWQRQYAYWAFFDHTAPFFQMVFDHEPVYFNYKDKTWLIEFWKGQYGINTGCEVGIYKADTCLQPSKRKNALYHPVTDGEMLPIEITLYRKGHPLFTLSKRHWWLAGFSTGAFTDPDGLHMSAAVTFPDRQMMYAFVEALKEKGCSKNNLHINGRTAVFHYDTPLVPQKDHMIRRAISQWKNRLLCQIYHRTTQPFCKNADRLLYLYYLLPSIFRKMLSIRKIKRKRRLWI